MKLNLNNRFVLISGSSRGIGFSIASAFLTEGAIVMLTSRNQNELDKASGKLGSKFGKDRVASQRCDFTKTKDIAELTKRIQSEWNRLDVLVANAGDGRSVNDPIPSRSHFDDVFSENFDTAVYAVRDVYPILKKSKGNMVFVSSIAGKEALGAPTDYAVAKAAVMSFSKNLARKLGNEGVRVNCVAPGNVLFSGGTWEQKLKTDPHATKAYIDKYVPLQRFASPDEIADAVLFLCSDRASFITGAVLTIDGGQTVGLF